MRVWRYRSCRGCPRLWTGAIRCGVLRACTGPAGIRSRGSAGIELADEAIRLADLTAARERTAVLLGHDHDGIPDDAIELIDVAVEIPMIGTGASLNVAVAGSLVLYRLAGFL
ncbi:MAG: TrmH family RNA methyltransferase [Trebonia sp.]